AGWTRARRGRVALAVLARVAAGVAAAAAVVLVGLEVHALASAGRPPVLAGRRARAGGARRRTPIVRGARLSARSAVGDVTGRVDAGRATEGRTLWTGRYARTVRARLSLTAGPSAGAAVRGVAVGPHALPGACREPLVARRPAGASGADGAAVARRRAHV